MNDNKEELIKLLGTLKAVGKHKELNDPKKACALLQSMATGDWESRKPAIRALGRMNVAPGGVLSNEEVLKALAAVEHSDDGLLQCVQAGVQGTELWVSLLRKAVLNTYSDFALGQLKSAAHDFNWGKLCEELKPDSQAAGAACFRICRAAGFDKEESAEYLLPFLLNIDEKSFFKAHLAGLEAAGWTAKELADYLISNMASWARQSRWMVPWEPLWPILEAAGADKEKAFLESLVKNLADHNSYGTRTWYTALHEMLLEKKNHGFPARLKPELLSLLRTHAWPRRHNDSEGCAGEGYLTRKLFERRAELGLSREELEKILSYEAVADTLIDAIKAAPEDQKLVALADTGLENASPRKLCEAFAEWREEMLPSPAQRFEKIRQAYAGRDIEAMYKAWRRALGKEFLLGSRSEECAEEAPASSVLLICRASDISLRFLLFMQPIPAADFAALLPWLEQVCSDTSRRKDGPHWFVARTKTERQDSDLSRSAPFSLAEAFAIKIPAAALPFLLQQVTREG